MERRAQLRESQASYTEDLLRTKQAIAQCATKHEVDVQIAKLHTQIKGLINKIDRYSEEIVSTFTALPEKIKRRQLQQLSDQQSRRSLSPFLKAVFRERKPPTNEIVLYASKHIQELLVLSNMARNRVDMLRLMSNVFAEEVQNAMRLEQSQEIQLRRQRDRNRRQLEDRQRREQQIYQRDMALIEEQRRALELGEITKINYRTKKIAQVMSQREVIRSEVIELMKALSNALKSHPDQTRIRSYFQEYEQLQALLERKTRWLDRLIGE